MFIDILKLKINLKKNKQKRFYVVFNRFSLRYVFGGLRINFIGPLKISCRMVETTIGQGLDLPVAEALSAKPRARRGHQKRTLLARPLARRTRTLVKAERRASAKSPSGALAICSSSIFLNFFEDFNTILRLCSSRFIHYYNMVILEI